MKNILMAFIATSFLFISLPAWSASTKEEIKALSVQVEEMQKDLAEIKKLIKDIPSAPAARPAAPPFEAQVVSVAGLPFMGKADAPVTLIEYSDYQCPFCARHYRDVFPDLIKDYIDTGKVKYVMRELPLTNIHPNAMNAALAALCANDQDKYFEMSALMFENQRELNSDNLKVLAGTIGLDTATFDECLDSKKHLKQIEADMASTKTFGITGTPGFAFGQTDPNDSDKANMVSVLKGAIGLSFFKIQIDPLLKPTDK